jgi:hypothetical protein
LRVVFGTRYVDEVARAGLVSATLGGALEGVELLCSVLQDLLDLL